MRAAWRCGQRGKRLPLAPREAALATAFETFLGLAPGSCPGCPFESVYGGVDDTGGWLSELLDARALVTTEGYAWPDALDGRQLVAVDRDALLAFKRADARMTHLEREQRDTDADG